MREWEFKAFRCHCSPSSSSSSSDCFFEGEDENEGEEDFNKISICAIPDCGYVGDMKWQELLPLVAVLGVAVFFVWRSSSQKKHEHGCGCGCPHEPEAETKKNNPPAH